jgi:DNA-directed RNA polymerase subunit RPC12/RpoP
MIQVGVLRIDVHIERWYLCFCVGCGAPIGMGADPRRIVSYRCPACATRIDSAPRHSVTGMADPEMPPIRMGDGLFVGLPDTDVEALFGG